MRIGRTITMSVLLTTTIFSSLQSDEGRDYNKELSAEDRKTISYIVTTLGTESYLSLLWNRKELEEAGDRTSHIHPLRYLGYMYSDDTLKGHAKNISGIPWKRFVTRFTDSLKVAKTRDNLQEHHVRHFAERIGHEHQPFQELINSDRWKALFELLQDL